MHILQSATCLTLHHFGCIFLMVGLLAHAFLALSPRKARASFDSGLSALDAADTIAVWAMLWLPLSLGSTHSTRAFQRFLTFSMGSHHLSVNEGRHVSLPRATCVCHFSIKVIRA